jgi:hypothetical protein
MSSGTQIDPSSTNDGFGGQVAPLAGASGAGTYLTDEEILGMEPVGAAASNRDVIPSEARNPSSIDDAGKKADSSSSRQAGIPRNDNENVGTAEQGSVGQMPAWMRTLAADPQHGAEAQQLWQEHQAFRAEFSSPAEAQALRQASQSVDRIDAAIFSGDSRAQSEVVAELARANPAAFRSLFAEAAKVLGVGQTLLSVPEETTAVAGAAKHSTDAALNAPRLDGQAGPRGGSGQGGPVLPDAPASQSPNFDPAAYSNFERSTNDAVARDVRTTIGDTLARVLPDGVAEGAARRIGDDIFNEIHRALAADRTLSEQVGDALRAPLASGQGWRFGNAEQQRVTSLLAGRANQLVPSVARRVIGEWTSSVLGTARSKAARQAAAASRVDIAAPGGSLDSMPLRAMSPREVNYASMSDDEILGL